MARSFENGPPEAQQRCTPESGTCRTCVDLCRHKPGWFLPGEAERAAELMDLPMPLFFERYLAVDWWEGHPDEPDGEVFVLSPAVVGGETGAEFDGDPKGQCVFLSPEGRCRIHAAKPHECREAWCGEDRSRAEGRGRHQAVATAWVGYHAQIVELLGREPVAAEYEGGGLFGLSGLFGSW